MRRAATWTTLVLAVTALSGLAPAAADYADEVRRDKPVAFWRFGDHIIGSDARGKRVSENRLVEGLAGGQTGQHVRVPLKLPFRSYFTATVRGGSPPSAVLDVLGQRVGTTNTISYARIRL